MAQKNLMDCNVTVASNDTASDWFGKYNDVLFSDDVRYGSDDESSEFGELDFSHERTW